jgi:WD40 repeat protein
MHKQVTFLRIGKHLCFVCFCCLGLVLLSACSSRHQIETAEVVEPVEAVEEAEVIEPEEVEETTFPPSLVLKGHRGWLHSVSFSPDGKRIVTSGGLRDHTTRIWDAESGEELMILHGHSDSVRSAFFSPDGKKIVTASADKTARIWILE